jgi:hypothetical protein
LDRRAIETMSPGTGGSGSESWQPPYVCLAWLIAIATTVAAVALVLTTVLLWASVRRAEVPSPQLLAIWGLYVAMVITGIKAMFDWMSERPAGRVASRGRSN